MKLNRKYITGFLKSLVVMLFFSAFFSHCASILSPTGGPRDSLPPVIVTLEPDNYTTNFDQKSVYIGFDEFVVIKDQQKEFYTSPAMKKTPTIYTRGRGIVVSIKDTLRENTTYSLNFGSSIRDNNEGNPLHSMRYVFSTGPDIDSMVVSGYTADSYKADSVSKTFIYFFAADSLENNAEYDSTMFNRKPDAIARAENNGIFIAQNLKPIRYRVFAYEDTNGNQMYEPGTDQIGFIEEEITPQDLPGFAVWYDSIRRYPSADPQLYFRMFTDVAFKRQILQGSERPDCHKAMLYFGSPNPQIESISFESIDSEDVIIDPITKGKDTIALWFKSAPETLPDTIRAYVSYYKHDSIRNLVAAYDTIKLPWRLVETREAEKARKEKEAERDAVLARGEEWIDPDNPFGYKLALNGSINPERDLSISFDYPIVKFDTTKLLLTSVAADSIVVDRPVRLERDTLNRRQFYIRSKWLGPEHKYTLTIPRGTFTDVAGFSNDSLVGSYTIADPEKFATVLIHLRGDESSETLYTVQLLNSTKKVIDEKRELKSGDVHFNYVPAGEISFRIIEDKNGNGTWDAGNAVERRQPERSEIFTKDGETIFATKVNWEVELDMDMNVIFAPVTMESLARSLEEQEIQRAEKQRIMDEEAAAQAAMDAKNANSDSGFSLNSVTSQL